MDAKGYRSNQENHEDYIRLCRRLSALPEPEDAGDAIAGIKDCAAAIAAREQASEGVTLTLPLLRRVLSLEPYAYFCVCLALCCELDGGCRNLTQEASGTAVPTFDLAAGLYSRYAGELTPEQAVFALSPENPLYFVFRLEESAASAQPLLFSPLVLRRGILQYLVGGHPANTLYDWFFPDQPGESLPLHQPALELMLDAAAKIRGGESSFLFLCGKAGSGKRTLARRAAARLGAPCVFLSCTALGQLDAGGLYALSRALPLDAALTGGLVCICGCTAEQGERLETLLRFFPESGLPLFLLSDDENCPPPALTGRAALRGTLGALSPADYALAADAFCARYALPPEERPGFYRLTVGRLRDVCRQTAELCRADDKAPFGKRFARAVRLMSGAVSKARPVESDAALTDLITAPETIEKLRMVCGFIRCIRADGGGWNRPVYGQGVTVLFYGPSGTGKTMAASAVANELGLELLKIDLSQVFDKYIGETEKHLSGIFAEARERNCILFFDEADALFSKRTEISSSHDRYANVETSFLLQSIEQYDGAVLLATNLFKNFDEAFLRRIDLLVRFSMPDEGRRLALWRQALADIPLARETDLPLLARELELTPAVIWSAARTARVMASMGGRPVGARELLAALENDFEKSGKSTLLAELSAL